jgi:putative membrane protein
MNRDDYFDYGHMDNGAGWFLTLLLAILLVAAIVALVAYTTNRAKPAAPAATRAPDEGQARRILDERLARGEIAPEEYRERRQALET